MSAELKPGYKQTEVGVIPEDWESVRAGDIGRFRGGNGFPTRFQGKTLSDYPFYKVSDMNNEGNETFMFDSNNWISEGTRKQLGATAFPTDSIIFAKVGAAVFLERKKILAKPSCIDNNLAGLVLNRNRTNVRFIHYALLNIKFGAFVSTTALPSLNGNVLSQIAFALPPLPEQEAIAEALSDADALIESLEQLITKKRHLKQGAMQELLTGKRRLPGLSGEWEVKRLGDVCRITTGRKDVNEGNPLGQYPFFTCARINTFSDSFSFEGEAILIAGNGDVGNLSYCNGKFEAYQRTYVLQSFTANVNYLWQQLTAYLADSLGIGKIGSSIPYIKMGNLVGFEFRSPIDVPEQTAIATILSDMDSEIVALDAKLAKTRALKQGMMQELLTGKTRLV
jgi:type I restriction enzyme S subunit